MASLAFTQVLPLSRCQASRPILATLCFVRFQNPRLGNKVALAAVSKKVTAESEDHNAINGEEVSIEKAPKTSKRAPRRSKKKTSETIKENTTSEILRDFPLEENETPVASSDDTKKIRKTRKKVDSPLEENAFLVESSGDTKKIRKTRKKGDVPLEENTMLVESSEDTKNIRRTRKKAIPSPTISEGEAVKKKVSRSAKTRKKSDDIKDEESDAGFSDHEGPTLIENLDVGNEDNFDFTPDGEDDISFTYGWPPLVCCFGAAQHAFVPSGRPANRLINYEIHDRYKDAFWAPEKFVRAPGSSSSSVALALASLGGRVAFMGKLGDDDYGQAMLYYLNENKIQTRSISIDSKKLTAVSRMKISRRGGLRMTCVKPCAEDSLLSSEINIDVLKEAKMFYFNSSSLLDQHMSLTTLRAIKISKKLGGIIFFDLNLPLPLWQSSDETKTFIQQAWSIADIIEVTKQELEFLCGIEPSEEFDTKDNAKAKFPHYKRDVIMPLWHKNLKVLFVTNGTSKIHYYTEEHHGWVHGMEDAPITPFTSDMSASGDGIVAALMRMLTVQPHLITDKGYLEHTLKYAVTCGVIDQWIEGRVRGFPSDEDAEEELVSDPNGIRSITEMEYRTHRPLESVS